MASSMSLTSKATISNLLRKLSPSTYSYSRSIASPLAFFSATSSTGDSDDESSIDVRIVVKQSKIWYPYLVEGPQLPNIYKMDVNGVYMRIDMPGVGKEGLKMSLINENKFLHIRGDEDPKQTGYGREKESPRKYVCNMYLPPSFCNSIEFKAVIKNGVLTIVVPRRKAN